VPEVAWEGITNLRDLGGPPAAPGLVVARGRVYRSASLHEMTKADRAALERLRVRTLIDLRTDGERRRQPYVLAGARAVRAPLAGEGVVEEITGRFRDGTITSAELEDWWTLTGVATAPETQVPGVRRTFRAFLALPPGEGALFHCRGGKDRTGLIAGLFLSALGVTRDDVVHDFLLSSNAPHHLPERESAAMQTAVERLDLSPAAIASLHSVRAEWLHAVLDRLEDRYGSVAAYLEERVGLGRGAAQLLRDRFLEPA
jgi:protein-tyrosine phosphatase